MKFWGVVFYVCTTLILGVFVLIHQRVDAVRIINIDPATIVEFQTEFKDAALPKIKQIENHAWSCDLYGARTQLQKQSKKSFYRFSQEAKKMVKNSGVQVIKTYQPTIGGLEGTLGPIQDTVRQSKAGKLISEISIPRREKTSRDVLAEMDQNRVVIAYVVCEKEGI